MKPGYLLFAGLIASLTATAARAAIYPYAEYHLGEAGSLSGTAKIPQDSSGANRHFQNGAPAGQSATISNAVSPAATGSTACLDTSTSSGDAFWRGGSLSFSSLPTDNFAFGIFARTDSGPSPVLSLGDGNGAFSIWQTGSKWQLVAYHVIPSGPGLAGNFTANQWAHLAVIRKAGVTRFYVNGVDQGSPFIYPPVHGSPMISQSFAGEYSYYFKGQLDEARLVTFTAGEADANILAALQGGIVPKAFVNVGSNASFSTAELSPAEVSVFRLGGATQDFARVVATDGLQVMGTAPQKHVIQIAKEGKLANGRYPLVGFSGTIGGQGLAGLELADLPGRPSGSLEVNAANSTIDLVVSGAESIIWTGAASNAWNKQDSNWVLDGSSTATEFLDADDAKFDDSPAGTVNAITVAEGIYATSITVDASENYSFSGAAIALSGPLTKKGTGTATLAKGFTGGGPIAIQGGTLSVGDGTAGGSMGTGPIALSSGNLRINRNDDVLLTNPITGSGSIGQLGSGRLTLNGSTSGASLTLAAGRIVAGNGSSMFTGATIAAGASLDLKGNFPGYNITINGGGAGGDAALLSSTGTVTLKEGFLLGSDASVGGGIQIKNQNPVTYEDPYPQSYPCTLTGNKKLTKMGGGIFSFYKTTVSLKDIEISGGSILADQFSVINNTNPGTIKINSGASLEFGNTLSYAAGTVGPTCAKPIVLNGGTVAASGGPFFSIGLPGGIQLDGPGGTVVAERFNIFTSPSGPIPTANITVSGVVSGSGSLTVGGYGIVSLTQAPAYTGDTTILAQPGDGYLRGRLSLALPGLADTSTVSIADGATLGLGFSGTDTVRRLFINGVQQQAGVYGSSHVSGRILGSGTLTVTEGPPATPPYQVWAQANGVSAAGADADSDGDGISNGMEFVLGGNPSGPDVGPNTLLPSITRSGNTVKFIYRRTDASSSANYTMRVETSSNLAANNWAPAPNSPVVEDDGFGPGVDKVTVTIDTAGAPKLFARLKVEGL